ncbi:hypothetical protein C5B42_02205 [Candidatus Cerribacteria bacterium 'Amazon FNV 2010 28 9']|uniref:TVP38/TMEM64 family membrane protein n=1 Tax=Candidatus Cerribacteria bacterium 'Amazon FNV 2010 28 9' TaxID=2081795 RepID=A0A317JQ99_9BACT|nr:MAG: hypothetical protein C5B42_02205 [Candidatus Cerribacteria bacterium 'Amazon FNV 2010 28 9']
MFQLASRHLVAGYLYTQYVEYFLISDFKIVLVFERGFRGILSTVKNNSQFQPLSKLPHRWLVYVFIGFVILAIVAYFSIHHPRLIRRSTLRRFEQYTSSYGSLAPIAIFVLMLISTVIPVLPLPTPIIELAAGALFGFVPGFLLIWLSQIISSLAAYVISLFFGKRFFKGLQQRRFWQRSVEYVHEHGVFAVFVSRFTMSSPFNIISFIAGLAHMNVVSFTIATIGGTILESALYTYIGFELRQGHVSLWLVSIGVLAICIIGVVLLFSFLRAWNKKKML